MFGIRAFLMGSIVGAGTSYFALNYHVIHAPQGPIVVSRTERPAVRTAYVDVRNWSAAMWRQHTDVTAALVKSGQTDLIAKEALSSALGSAEATAPTWTGQEFKSGLQEKAKTELDSLMNSLPRIDFEEVRPDPVPVTTTIPPLTDRSSSATATTADRFPLNGTGPAESTVPANPPSESGINLGPDPSDLLHPGQILYEERKSILGEPAALPGTRVSPVAPTAQTRTVPSPTGSPFDAFKSLFNGSSNQQSAAPPSDRIIKTKAF